MQKEEWRTGAEAGYGVSGDCDALPNAIRRYSRLAVCATGTR